MPRINTQTGRDKNVPACLISIAIFIAICTITLALKLHKIMAIKIATDNAEAPENKGSWTPKGPETLGFRAFSQWCERGDLNSHRKLYTD